MSRPLSYRTLSLIAIGLAVASAVLCWRWCTRYKAMISKYETEVLLLQSRQDDFEFHVLNLAALLMKSHEDLSGSGRLSPVTAQLTRAYGAVMSNPKLRAIERARADSFLYWYYHQIQERHLNEATAASAPETQNEQPVEEPEGRQFAQSGAGHHLRCDGPLEKKGI